MVEKRMTVVLLLLGKYEMQLEELDQRLKELETLPKDMDVVIVGDDQHWSTIPALQMFQMQHPKTAVIFCKNHCLPAVAMNRSLGLVKTPYVVFSLLGDPIRNRVEQFFCAIDTEDRKQENKKTNKNQIELKEEKAFYICPAADQVNRDVYLPMPDVIHGWAMSSEKSFCMGSFCAPVAWIRQLGGFDESPLLLEEIERWYALLVVKSGAVLLAGNDNGYVKRLREYPLYRNGGAIPRDLAVRYATYCMGSATNSRNSQECASQFANDLRDEEVGIYKRLTGIDSSIPQKQGKRYRILIMGGLYEYHHNQVCFFNYLERMYGRGFATFRSVLEYSFDSVGVLGYDLVIFTRCRSKNAIKIAAFCGQQNIPTLYMIDDNWLTIAKDHPEQGSVFVAGNENYDNFLELLGLCKATWLFSDVIRQDVLPYTRCVKKFKISVDPRLFHSKTKMERQDGMLYIGFSGSMRYDNTAFMALARYARAHKNVTVVLVGVLSQEQEMLFKGIKTIRVPFCSYSTYAATISHISPDLLIAPLQHTRTMKSKCYNKYVESGIAGSACIFSKCRPYTDVVVDGENGYFAEEESFEGWYRKLESVLTDVEKLRKVQKNAYEDIIANHTVDVILPEFCMKLSEVIDKENLTDD